MQSDDNDHITLCGTFSVLSDYIDLHYRKLTDDQHREFWEWIEWQATSNDEDISTAAVTCFLENVAATEVETYGKPFMSPELIKWFDVFMGRGRRKRRWFER